MTTFEFKNWPRESLAGENLNLGDFENFQKISALHKNVPKKFRIEIQLGRKV